jgi:hypothetical protein
MLYFIIGQSRQGLQEEFCLVKLTLGKIGMATRLHSRQPLERSIRECTLCSLNSIGQPVIGIFKHYHIAFRVTARGTIV